VFSSLRASAIAAFLECAEVAIEGCSHRPGLWKDDHMSCALRDERRDVSILPINRPMKTRPAGSNVDWAARSRAIGVAPIRWAADKR